MPLPVPRPGRVRALRLAAASCHPAAVLRYAFALGLYVTPPRVRPEPSAPQLPPPRRTRVARPLWASRRARPPRNLAGAAAAPSPPSPDLALPQKAARPRRMGLWTPIPRRAHVARPPRASNRACPPRSLACAAAAPIAPSSDPALPHKARRLGEWDCAKHSQPRSRRAAALELRPSQSRSHPRLRRRRARRAQLDLALLQDSADPSEWDCRHPRRRARGPRIPQPRSPGSQATRLRRPPLQKSSCRSHTPPEGTLRS